MSGAEVFNEPGALCWNELVTRDPAGARRCYTRVFGWDAKDHPLDQWGSYWAFPAPPIADLRFWFRQRVEFWGGGRGRPGGCPTTAHITD